MAPESASTGTVRRNGPRSSNPSDSLRDGPRSACAPAEETKSQRETGETESGIIKEETGEVSRRRSELSRVNYSSMSTVTGQQQEANLAACLRLILALTERELQNLRPLLPASGASYSGEQSTRTAGSSAVQSVELPNQ
jgi:hypothetical protein